MEGGSASEVGSVGCTLYTSIAMRALPRLFALLLTATLISAPFPPAFASAYNGHPRLIVVIVIDQFRADYLEHYRDQFGEVGFRTFLDKGAYFTDCSYDYANTRTAPGHATLFTGAYSNGHGIVANEWWDPQKKKMVSSVEDDSTHLVGTNSKESGASPHNLLASTLGDQLKLASQGKSRVFGIALKDRAAILPAGFAADAAYWIDHQSGAWISSTYYRDALPKWAADFNAGNRTTKYWDREWKDAEGNVLRSTAHQKGKNGGDAGFYEVVGSTPFANDYEFEFAKELMLYEQVGMGPATDLLTISLSANDILGHQVGPDSPEMRAMALALDRQLADFFDFLGHQVGLANVWIALSADHGVAPVPAVAAKLRIPAVAVNAQELNTEINKTLSAKLSPGHATDFIRSLDYPVLWLNEEAFSSAKTKEDDAERDVGEALRKIGMRSYFTKAQLAAGNVAATELGKQYLNSYSPEGGWYVLGVPPPFSVASPKGTDHASPYSYDTHVPLAFYGLAFQPGTYRSHAEPVDMVSTFASLLGIIPPTHAIGRVLVEALAPPRHEPQPIEKSKPAMTPGDFRPAVLPASRPLPEVSAQ
jgi:predicted AlkP superfamily pyrophosphatase or phosphodiesterase